MTKNTYALLLVCLLCVSMALAVRDAMTCDVTATVYNVNDDVMTLETADGNLWDWEGIHPGQYQVGGEVVVTFHRHHPETLFDDEILTIKGC